MWTPPGKVHASAREYAARPPRRSEIDVERGQSFLSERGDGEIPPLGGQPPGLQHGLEDLDRHLESRAAKAVQKRRKSGTCLR